VFEEKVPHGGRIGAEAVPAERRREDVAEEKRGKGQVVGRRVQEAEEGQDLGGDLARADVEVAVGDEGNLDLVEPGCGGGDGVVPVGEDGDIGPGEAARPEIADAFLEGRLFRGIVLVFFEDYGLDIAAAAVSRLGLLAEVRKAAQRPGRAELLRGRQALQEEAPDIVLDDAAAPVVRLELADGGVFRRDGGKGRRGVVLEVFHDPVVGVPETVDRLLGVADGEEASAEREGVFDERQQVRPLDGRRVLELVDEVVEDPVAEAEVDVGDGARLDASGQPPVDVLDEHGFAAALEGFEGFGEGPVGQDDGTEVVAGIEGLEGGDGGFQAFPGPDDSLVGGGGLPGSEGRGFRTGTVLKLAPMRSMKRRSRTAGSIFESETTPGRSVRARLLR
jgi:hypothetical protein